MGTISWEPTLVLGRILYYLGLTWPFTWFMWLGLLNPRRALYCIATRNNPLLVVMGLCSSIAGAEVARFWGLVASTLR